MKKKMLTASLTLCALLPLSAGPELNEERWPDGSEIDEWFYTSPNQYVGEHFCISDYGAEKDSTILQTAAIQKAIDAAAINGGVVVIPEGVWLSGALFFKPGTHLYLEEGAVLKGSSNTWDFPDVPVHIEGVLQPYASALINASGCDGFSISGKGKLNGNGLPYWEAFWNRRKENPKCTNLEVRRPRMIGLSHCRNVVIEGISLENSAFWNIHLYKCSRVFINNVHIFAPIKPVKAPSSDGIDIDACSDVHIADCMMGTGDDLIAIKGGKGPWANEDPDNGTNERILVENCKFFHGPGALVFGSECLGADNVLMRNCKVSGTERLLWLKMRPDTPQRYSNILIENVSGKAKNAVYVKPWTQFFDLKGRKDTPFSATENIRVQRCTVTCRRSFNVVEAPDQYNVDIHLEANKWRYASNKDESAIKQYSLPDPLVFADGTPVASPSEWPARRDEILGIFQKEMYGSMPPGSPVYLKTLEQKRTRDKTAIRRQVRMTFQADGGGPHIDWLILYPAKAKGPVPAIMMLNYYGNDDVFTNERFPVPAETILSRGYAYVTACYEDISPDPDTLQNPSEQLAAARQGIFKMWAPSCTTGSLMAWAWSLCRGMDMLEKDSRIDASKVVVTGSSRLGKAALIAGAFDQRFAAVVVNQTGGGGVPLSKRNYGEYVGSMVDQFCYWWCKSFSQYAGREKSMPFDQHMLLACIAPRPLLVEGFDHKWFDTKGEFLAMKAASPVWEFLGAPGLPDVEWPDELETKAIGPNLGYVWRTGKHGIAEKDWMWLLDFADNSLKK